MAEILPIRRKTLSNQSINQAINQSVKTPQTGFLFKKKHASTFNFPQRSKCFTRVTPKKLMMKMRHRVSSLNSHTGKFYSKFQKLFVSYTHG